MDHGLDLHMLVLLFARLIFGVHAAPSPAKAHPVTPISPTEDHHAGDADYTPPPRKRLPHCEFQLLRTASGTLRCIQQTPARLSRAHRGVIAKRPQDPKVIAEHQFKLKRRTTSALISGIISATGLLSTATSTWTTSYLPTPTTSNPTSTSTLAIPPHNHADCEAALLNRTYAIPPTQPPPNSTYPAVDHSHDGLSTIANIATIIGVPLGLFAIASTVYVGMRRRASMQS